MSLELIQLNSHNAIWDTEQDKVALLPDGSRILQTLLGVYGATDQHGREIELQFYERNPDDVISRQIQQFEL